MKKRLVAIMVSLAMILALFAVPALAGAAPLPAAPSSTYDSTADLQAAIDGASAGDVIDLGNNSYNVSVLTIDKKVTLENGTINLIPASLPAPGFVMGSAYCSTIQMNASGAALDNVAINGFNSFTDSGNTFGSVDVQLGSFFSATPQPLTDLTIKNCSLAVGSMYDSPISDPFGNYGFAIQSNGDPDQVDNVTISGNTFSQISGVTSPDCSNRYIYLNAATGVDISDNTFENALLYSSAITMDGASGSITGNTFDKTSLGGNPAAFIQLINNHTATAVAVDGNIFNGDSSTTQCAVKVGDDPAYLTSFEHNVINNFVVNDNGLIPVIVTYPYNDTPSAGVDSTNDNNNITFNKTEQEQQGDNFVSYYNASYNVVATLKDEKTDAPLAGATFELKDSSGKVVGTAKTDAAGQVAFSDLAYNAKGETFTLSETSAPRGYSAATSQKAAFAVGTYGTVALDFVNAAETEPAQITVKTNVDGVVTSKTVDEGSTVADLGTASKSGSTFKGWALEANGTVLADSTTLVDGTTYYAVFSQNESTSTPPLTTPKTGDSTTLPVVGVVALLAAAGAAFVALRRRHTQA